MPKKFATDLYYFDNFDSAKSKADDLMSGHPDSRYEILYTNDSKQFELWFDKFGVIGDFPELFGPGDVPGYLSDGDIQAIHDLSKMAPPGDILEVGGFLGKSTVEWAKNLPDTTIHCIDSFNAPVDFLTKLVQSADFDLPPGDSHLAIFKHYTQHYINIKPVSAFFKEDFVWNKKLALVFEDGDHQLQTLSYALPFWWDKLINNGILSGHDYHDDVKQAVDLFAAENNLTVNTCNNSSIWYIIKQ